MGAKRRAAANKRKPRTREVDTKGEHFPWAISLACLCAGLYLFLSSTVPALREKMELRKSENSYRQAVDRVSDQTLLQRRRLQRLADDPEVLLVEFDRQGMLPETAIERYAERLTRNEQLSNR